MSPEEVISQRNAVVAEALSWIGTPFHHNACIKGVGVDCAHVGATFERVLGIKFQFPEYYSPQWHLHEVSEKTRFVEMYLEGLKLNNFIEIEKDKILPGDIVLSKIGRTFCHGGLIVGWPSVVQAESVPIGAGKVVKAYADANWFLSGRELKFFTRKEWL